jgi:tryptophan synthase beta chain
MHILTAITRDGSKDKLPEGVKIAQVDYDDEATIFAALEGQQILIITLSVAAPQDTHSKLIKAAAKAGVPYVMPNC